MRLNFFFSSNASVSGNTVLHHLAILAQSYTAQMYDFIMSLDSENGNPTETITNTDGLTPFKLAALEGNVQVTEFLMHFRSRIFVEGCSNSQEIELHMYRKMFSNTAGNEEK